MAGAAEVPAESSLLFISLSLFHFLHFSRFLSLQKLTYPALPKFYDPLNISSMAEEGVNYRKREFYFSVNLSLCRPTNISRLMHKCRYDAAFLG
jgi:hypothetical protein